jgi:GT2 family glycosyltransferase
MLVRREAYDQVKGFDDRFFPAWYEDVDFCNRLQAAGWKVCFDRQAQFVHEGGYSAEILGASDFLTAYYRNQIRYVNKYFSASAGLVRLSIAARIAARWIRARSRVSGCSRMITGALWDW